ncbi:methyl-accepting chemotaxis protein [Echinimonas agarilytica]|uniref:Methyl-accepting chemotaxis protein n=1 Tax=Echinimonas agarilytica TaxID=1215918 RepID=A0AA41W9F0_9GAMM|nr:methyl-accepting chemotaxis protein [Echinimonas agarilytica]MCM2681062.1 methyl-accepting chemotaxis protein [Echinimonas agarilytica]
MRVSHYARFSAVALFSVSVAFVGLLFWVQQQLDLSDKQRGQYELIKETASMGVVAALQKYLAQGDAVVLIEVEERLHQLDEELVNLPGAAAAPIREQVQLLLDKTKSDYRAIGKLSGDPMALLKISEREMLSSAKSLIRYASEGHANNPFVARNYADLSTDSILLVHELSQARIDLLSGHASGDDHLTSLLNDLASTASEVVGLPLLEVYHEAEVDEFALGDDDSELEEKGELARDELMSLARRYPSELERTRKIATQRQHSFRQLEQDLNGFKTAIAYGETMVSAERQRIVDGIKLAAGIMVAVLLFITVSNYMLQFTYVLKPLRQLRQAFHHLVESNELTTIDVRNKKSELGEIAQYFNQLIQHEQNELARRQQQLKVVSEALQTISEQVNHICHSNSQTEQHLLDSRQTTAVLSDITQELSKISDAVESNARETESSMELSLTGVAEVLAASEQTSEAATLGFNELSSLSASVEDVSAILDVIRNIADQTNLLALNAAIESARAGVHGRGFSVVADEVRQLAFKTQNSLTEITDILSTLTESSQRLGGSITQVKEASGHQRTIAEQLMQTSEKVKEQSHQAVNAAHQASEFVRDQAEHVELFNQAMDSVQQQVEGARGLAGNIRDDVTGQASHITSTLLQTDRNTELPKQTVNFR